MSLRESLQDIASRPANDAVSKAYQQYALDERLDTEDDAVAFGEAIYAHIIDPLEDMMEKLSAEVVNHALAIDKDIQNRRSEFHRILGL